MAEAAVNTTSVSKFYCHSCSEEINPKLPDFTCPKCDNGFIEEIQDSDESLESSSPQEIIDPAANFAEIWGRAFLENFQQQVSGVSQDRPQRATRSDSRTDSDTEDTENEHPSLRQNGGPLPFTRIHVRTRNRQPNSRHTPYLQGLLQMFVDRLTDAHGPALSFVPMMHGNPGDYAWGVHGLDNIITQLLNQLEGSGPAPAEKTKIESVPVVKITQIQVDLGAQCSICFEDFEMDEDAKKLPCEHHYHIECIIKWLEIHGTCPVCRKDLNGIDSSLQDNYPTPADIIDSNISSQNNNTEEDDDSGV